MNMEKLTHKAQEALQLANAIAIDKQHSQIEPIHILMAFIEQDEGVAKPIFQGVGVDISSLKNKIEEILDSLPTVKDVNTVYVSSSVQNLIKSARKEASKLNDDYVSSEHILISFFNIKDEKISNLFKQFNLNKNDFLKILASIRGAQNASDPNAESKYRVLQKYTTNLTQRAREGKLDPVIGRDQEIRRVMQVLCRRTKNNPVLIGEPGVGKTAIAEGLARRIIEGDVPETLKNTNILALDLGSLVAGTKFRGEFEDRLKAILKEIRASNGNIIVFIDELHSVVGAGSAEGSQDAANMLKPALARGELRCIGATTLDEYRKYIEKDAALERRFQVVMVDEPSVEDTISILRGLKERYEIHHGVRIKDDALIAAANLSERYISDRFLPDKAIDLVDEAAAGIRMQVDSMPTELDNIERVLLRKQIEAQAIKKEKDKSSTEKLKKLEQEISSLKEKSFEMKTRWQNEKNIIIEIRKIKADIEAAKNDEVTYQRQGDLDKVAQIRYGIIPELERKLIDTNNELNKIQKSNQLLKEEVDEEDIAGVVSRWTGIPVNKMLESEKHKLINLEEELHKRVVGQDEAIAAVSNAVRRSRANLQDPNRPIGSFIFMGPTGVGKTELAKALAEFLFNTEQSLIRIDMSEYMEKHSVSKLVGAPPGYIGYEEGGTLTEAVRRRPYSVVLFDEIEKAHFDVFNILLQILDEGHITDSQGRRVNFKNTIVIMTSNLGSHLIQEYAEKNDSSDDKAFEQMRNSVMNLFKSNFKPEFLNRIDDIILFYALTQENVKDILNLQISRFKKRLNENKIELDVSTELLNQLAKEGYDPVYGARPIKRLIQTQLQNKIATMILNSEVLEGDKILADLNKTNKIEFITKKKEKGVSPN